METLVSVLIAGAITIFFLVQYKRKLSKAASHAAPGEPSAAPPHSGGNPRPVIDTSVCIGCGSCVDACPEAGALAVISGKAVLTHPERCVAHALCVEACPTQGIKLSAAGILQTVTAPVTDDYGETVVPGIFVAGEVGGAGLIKISINQGKLAVDRIAERLKQAPARGGAYDVAIVGAGPAGLSATLTAQQHGLNYVCLEQGEIAATIRNFPRRKLVFAEPLELPLFGALYMDDSSRESLLKAWDKIIAATGVEIRTNTKVEAIAREAAGFRIETSAGVYRAANLVLAIGKRGSPRRLGVPGEDLDKVAYRLIDAGEYRGKDILVVGGGDSAVECALGLARKRRNRVTLSYRGDSFSRLKQRNAALLRTAEAEGTLAVLRKSQVVEIGPDFVVLDHAGERQRLSNHFVFVMAGGTSPNEFLRRIGIETAEKTIGAPSETPVAA